MVGGNRVERFERRRALASRTDSEKEEVLTNVFSQRDWSAFLEHAEDHGVIEEPVLDAFALEHEAR